MLIDASYVFSSSVFVNRLKILQNRCNKIGYSDSWRGEAESEDTKNCGGMRERERERERGVVGEEKSAQLDEKDEGKA